jgi:prepilin-type N-terminal cleavage/methylation domain-containing protein
MLRQQKRKRRRRESGFTIIEVLIAAIVAGIALTAAFAVFINHNKSHIVQAGITDMQQNGRATIDELVVNIRRAGYRLPEALPALAHSDTNPDTLLVAFMHEPACSASLSHPMPQPSAELKCVGSDLSCFEDNMWAYIWEESSDTGEFFWITHIQEAAMHIQHNLGPLTRKYGPGAQIFVIDHVKYYVDTTDLEHPTMMIQTKVLPDIYADNIEDLQFSFVLVDGSLTDVVPAAKLVREVLINVVARTDRHDLFLGEHRRENFSTRVRVRNL